MGDDERSVRSSWVDNMPDVLEGAVELELERPSREARRILQEYLCIRGSILEGIRG